MMLTTTDGEQLTVLITTEVVFGSKIVAVTSMDLTCQIAYYDYQIWRRYSLKKSQLMIRPAGKN